MATVAAPAALISDIRLAPPQAVAVGRRLCAVAVAAFLFTAVAPVGASIVTVFLFAGPHNWFEARYFLRRLPPRWRTIRTYFSVGALGAIGLTAGFALLPWLAVRGFAAAGPWTDAQWVTGVACWNVALVGWTATLAALRRRMSPTRRWPWLWPAAAMAACAGWYAPRAWDVALVYAHPLVALWFLDREVGRLGAGARAGFRRALVIVPILALLLIGVTAAAPPLAGDDVLTSRIIWHAGSDVFAVVSNRCPVALHVFLESIHYAVWIVLLPLVALRTAPWQLGDIPLVHRSAGRRRGVAMVLVAGLAVAAVLWCGFLLDYPLTRDVYFTVAMLHVLAEIPFLLRLV
jgi:hypothetical protein